MRTAFATAGILALFAGGVQVSGVLKPGAVYTKPFDTAYAELAATPIPPMIAKMFPGSPRIVRNANSIEWHFRDQLGDRATFTAFLSSEDPTHTRVAIDVAIDPGKAPLAARYLSAPLMLDIARQALAEQVSAELEDRPFDKMRFGHRMGAYLAAHPEDLKAFSEMIRDTMNDVATQVNGYPSKGAPNYRPSLSTALAGFAESSAQMNGKVIRDAESWSAGSNSAAEPPAPVDAERVRADSTRAATDLSAYR